MSFIIEDLRKYRKLLFILLTASLIFSQNFEANAWFGDPNIKKIVAQVDTLCSQDELEKAKTFLVKYENKFKNDPLWKTSFRLVNSLIISKGNYEKGKKLYDLRKFQSALELLSDVSIQDSKRYSDSQLLIKKIEIAVIDKAISSANSLVLDSKYEDALSVLENVKNYSYIQDTKFRNLYEKIKPLAVKQKDKRLKKGIEAKMKYIAKLKASLKLMKVKTDKFNGYKFYRDRTSPYYSDNNAFYLYIGKASKNSQPYLLLIVRYSDDDWLFVDSAEISIDGSVQDLDLGDDWSRDNGGSSIWEWVEIEPNEAHLLQIEEIIKAKKAVIRFYGSQYRDDFTITSTQKRALRNVLNAYKALMIGY
jgi:hypothetical protein